MISFSVLIVKHPSKADTGNIPKSKHTEKEMIRKIRTKNYIRSESTTNKTQNRFKALKPERKNHMTLANILISHSELINDKTIVYIRNEEKFSLLAYGNWYQDNILKYHNIEISSFTWQDNDEFYVDLKKGE